MKVSPRTGALMPLYGFSRRERRGVPADGSLWVSPSGLEVISSLCDAYLPGTNETKSGPTWHISVERTVGGIEARCRTTDEDLQYVVAAFDMPAFDEDNHHPGVARHLFCPVDEQYRSACECKTTETVVVEESGYTWTTDDTEECRGCWYERHFGKPCPRHAGARCAPIPCPPVQTLGVGADVIVVDDPIR